MFKIKTKKFFRTSHKGTRLRIEGSILIIFEKDNV